MWRAVASERIRISKDMRSALVLWGLTAIAATVGGVAGHRTVTGVYHEAVHAWSTRTDLYGHGYQYLPQFVVLFWPFDQLPFVLSEIAWRLVSICALGVASWRLVCAQIPAGLERQRVFLQISMPILLTGFDSFRNGQANTLFGAVSIFGACSLFDRRNGEGSSIAPGYFVVASLIKVFGVIEIVFAGLLRPLVILRSITLGAAAILVPFCLAPSQYVCRQYQLLWLNLMSNANLADHRFADLNGLLLAIASPLSAHWSIAVRAIAALLGGVILVHLVRWRPPNCSPALILYGTASSYWMLFNPMTEQNSYVIVAPFLTLIALGRAGQVYDPLVKWGMLSLVISMTVLPELVRRQLPDFGLWWHPLIMAVLLIAFAAPVLRRSFSSVGSMTTVVVTPDQGI